ncbi:MAG: hypothetical protein HN465_09260 [Nitrospina sp.]|jgi:hypothetical protein|nr:hypothetical protein [Nitrospina sp.]
MFLVYRLFQPLLILVLYVFVVFVSIESVSAKTKNIKVSISYKPKVHEQLNVKKFKLNHPIKISKREIVNHLVSLRYKGLSMGNKEMGVFFPDEIKKLVPILVKAFAGVDSRKVIHIELKGKTGTTVGDAFSFKNYLSWRFESIHGETFFQKNNARGWSIFAWKLMPQKGQLYYKSSENKRIHKNWLVTKLHLPVSKIKDRAINELSDIFEGGDLNNKMNQELERKLRNLKHLYDQGLIEEEEYKVQQKKLFEKLF